MATTRELFITKRWDGFGGNYINSQYLGWSYDAGKPHIFENTLMKIYSSKTRFFTGKALIGMTGAKSYGVKEIENEVYRWKLQGAEYKCARVMENVESGNTAPGLNGVTFKIKLDLDYFQRPDVLMPEDSNYSLEIVDGPITDGNGYIYYVRLQGDSPENFLPTYLLEPGREFSCVWTTVRSEGNDEFGTQQFPSAFELEGQVGAFAQKLSVTDKAMRMDNRSQGRFGVEFMYTDPNTGKSVKVDKFLPMAESIMYNKFYESMEAQAMYGVKETRAGIDGYWTKTGAGIRQQLRGGHIEYYNGPLTVNKVKDYLLNIFFARENEGDRKVVAMTGTLGSIMFHDMLASEASSFLTVDTHFTQKLSENPRHLSYGAQFTHYQGPEGIEMTVIKNPMYDSRKYEKRNHPIYTEFPIDSARFTFLDFGSESGESNIQMVKVKDTYRRGYVMGTVGPMGPVQGGQAGALKAGYDIFVEGTMGIWMKDPTRGGELIYDYDAQ